MWVKNVVCGGISKNYGQYSSLIFNILVIMI
jgi:hypothetical protein